MCNRKEEKTELGKALKYIHNGIKKRCICFVLSDFLAEGYEEALRVLARQHDCIGIHCWDQLEKELPDVGVLRVADAETGEQIWVDTTSITLRRQYWRSFEEHTASTQTLFRKAGADFLSVGTHQPYTKALLKFFSNRSHTVSHG
ncbi:MAG: hypothetical protein R2778_01620 [Saprospiraceae bacterium]